MTEGKNETIVDRVVARLKAQPLGDLITEEDLHDIVKEAIPRTFFEKREKVDGHGFHTRTVEADPLIVEVMREVLQLHVKKAVEDWLAANAELMALHLKSVVDTGILKYAQARLETLATDSLRTTLRHAAEEENRRRSAAGLPMVNTYF